MKSLRLFSFLMILWCISESGKSQSTINDYYPATAISTVNNTITVTTLSGINGIHTLAIGDTVLIIQMKGASINTTNTASYGNITATGTAGAYEINVICSINGNEVGFKKQFLNAYSATGALQIVSHGDGKLTTYTSPGGAGLTATAWNGSAGGVVFLKATTSITLGGNIDVSGKGFRGGAKGGIVGLPGTVCNKNVVSPAPACTYLYTSSACNGAIGQDATGYYYPQSPFTVSAACGGNHESPPAPNPAPATTEDFYKGAGKGEAVAAFVTGQETGRGKIANGGGGGMTHNSGGAGGANYGAGGDGGYQYEGAGSTIPFLNGGIGGAALTPSVTRIYMGGGGGSGHGNYSRGNPSGGGGGGGIVIIVTNTLSYAAARSIITTGVDVVGMKDSDSEGGGGAGGSIYIAVNTITNGGNNLTLDVSGGDGGDSEVPDASTAWCMAPGGGGGGGYILSKIAIPAPNTIIIAAGNAGTVTQASIPNWSQSYTRCGPGTGSDIHWGAKNGTPGASSVNAGFALPKGTVDVACIVPVTMLYFTTSYHDNTVYLKWATASEHHHKLFIVERSSNGILYQAIGSIQGQGHSTSTIEYDYADSNPLQGTSYYRLRQIDINGDERISAVSQIDISDILHNFYLYPIPAQHEIMLSYTAHFPENIEVYIHDVYGNILYRQSYAADEGDNRILIHTPFPSGVYTISIKGYTYYNSEVLTIE